MIELKRNCNSSVKDTGESVIFGAFTIKIAGDFYIRLMEIKNELNSDLQISLLEVIYRGLER